MTREPWPPRTVLVAVDSGQAARALVDRATTLSLLLGAELCIVHAVCVRATDLPLNLSGLLEGLEVLDVNAHAMVSQLARRVAASGLAVSTVVQHGEPYRVVSSAIRSERAGLLVIGARRRPGLARALLPGLGSDLSALGGCSVLTVPLEPESS